MGYEGALLGACACALRGMEGPLDEASLPGRGSELRVMYADGKTTCRLLCEGEDLLAHPGAGELGAFLMASGVMEDGIALDGVLGDTPLGLLASRARRGDTDALLGLEKYGSALGEAVSFCATLLDPASIVFEGDLAFASDLFQGVVLKSIEGDSYWQREGLPYSIEWQASPE